MQPPLYHEAPSKYWAQSRRPLAALYFAGPLLVIYETSLLCLGSNALRNGADDWMRRTLNLLGFRTYLLLPFLTVAILLGWHHVLRQSWRVPRVVLCAMAGECLSLAAALWLCWSLYHFLFQVVAATVGLSIGGLLATISSYLGAGIYEELLFRLILLNLAVGLLAWLKAGPRQASWVGSS